MAQLSNDCFAFGGELMVIEEGLRLISERVTPVAETETVPLAQADGRILAKDIIAPLDLPGFDNSAVDGWAVRHADLKPDGDTVLPVQDRIAAGDRSAHRLAPGTVARIFTGAAMPAGADTVFMQEDVREDGGNVVLPAGLSEGANRRLAGEDIAMGAVALAAGQRIEPRHLALAAALGITELSVHRRLRVGVLSTGDEVTEPGTDLPPGGLYDANRFLLIGMLKRIGVEVTDLGIFRDEPGSLGVGIAEAAKTHDLLISSGGVSTGEEDHTRHVVEKIGTLVQWRLAIKPGRPVAMAVVHGTPFVGLPGNPVAVFVTYTQVVRALIARLAGEDWTPPEPVPVRAAFPYKKKSGRREFVRVTLHRGADGVTEAHKHPREGAGVITSLTESSGLVELREDVTRLAGGEMVGYRSFADLF